MVALTGPVSPLSTTWLRWEHRRHPSKWHWVESPMAMDETACGQRLQHARYEVRETATLPADAYGVCLHCIRAREMASRVIERMATLATDPNTPQEVPA